MVATDGRSVSGEERMKRLWEALSPEQVPAEVLFCNRPFYEEIGAGWMPKSLLRDQAGSHVDHLSCGMAIRKEAENGILVRMVGVMFEVPVE